MCLWRNRSFLALIRAGKNLARPLVPQLEAINVCATVEGTFPSAPQKSKTIELLRRKAMKFRPLHDRVVVMKESDIMGVLTEAKAHKKAA